MFLEIMRIVARLGTLVAMFVRLRPQ